MARTPQEYVDLLRDQEIKPTYHFGMNLPMTPADTRIPISAGNAMIAAVFLVLEQLGATDQQIDDAFAAIAATRFDPEPQASTTWTVPPEWY